MSMKIKKPNIKKILKAFGKGILNTFTMLTISIGSVLAFSSYINPVPFIAQQFPDLILGTYTLELLFNDVKIPFEATRYHSLIIERQTLHNDFEIIAETENDIIMATTSEQEINYNELNLFFESCKQVFTEIDIIYIKYFNLYFQNL